MDVVLTMPMVALRDAMRARELSPVDVVEAHIQRILQVDPYLNAVPTKTFERARAEARAAERRYATEDLDALPPFLGVPFTLKEHYAAEGLPQTAGLLARRHAHAPQDSTPMRRMAEAGFILLGTTNVPEGLTWYETNNPVYGRTRNPWDLSRIPGGSSGGEAAIIGAGGSPIGVGGDIGGSIRNPAFFCGVAGHKPSGGVVPETGAWPGVSGKVARYKVVGPLARTVADCRAVMPILAGPDGQDTSVDDLPWTDDPGVDLSDVVVYRVDRLGLAGPTPGVKVALDRAQAALEAAGIPVVDWQPPGLERAYELWATALSQAGAHAFADQLVDFGEPLQLAPRWAEWLAGRPRHIGPALALATVEKVLQRFPSYGKEMASRVDAVKQAIEAHLGPAGAMLLPPFHRTAPRHGAEAFAAVPGFIYCAALNPLELPSTAVPTGFDRQGLPTGVQIAAGWRRDALTLHLAEIVEHACGRWQPPARIGPV